MIHIAILEDEQAAATALLTMLNTYAETHQLSFSITHYTTAEEFLATARGRFDIAFLDIELSGMDGMNAAFKLRENDRHVQIIFVTNMAQYAVRGYEVGALYYIIKPIDYPSVAHKLGKTLALLQANADHQLLLRQRGELKRISSQMLMYVEVADHKLLYHMVDETLPAYGSLADVEEALEGRGFFRCNNCYLVNVRFIASVKGMAVTLTNGEQLMISHPRKKAFMLALGSWLGKGNTRWS